MSDRITNEVLANRAQNVNRRIESTGRIVVVEGRNGYTALDEYELPGVDFPHGAVIRTITVGTKREVAEFLHAMMVGIDLARCAS